MNFQIVVLVLNIEKHSSFWCHVMVLGRNSSYPLYITVLFHSEFVSGKIVTMKSFFNPISAPHPKKLHLRYLTGF